LDNIRTGQAVSRNHLLYAVSHGQTLLGTNFTHRTHAAVSLATCRAQSMNNKINTLNLI
jgi:hypothetical protein